MSKTYFTVLIITVVVISLSFMIKPQSIQVDQKPECENNSILVYYGEAIFKRENCGFCHPLEIRDTNRYKISLDGYGGQRSNTWNYSFLMDPEAIIPKAVMPTYKFLSENALTKHNLQRIIDNNKEFESIPLDTLWANLQEQSEAIINSFEFPDGVTIESNEIVALIAYLQQIPASPERRRLDSLENVRLQKIMETYNRLYENFDEVLANTSTNEENLTAGEQLYKMNCVACHGIDAKGGLGPDLTDSISKFGMGKSVLAKVIVEGTTKGMPAYRYKIEPIEVAQVVVYLQSLQ